MLKTDRKPEDNDGSVFSTLIEYALTVAKIPEWTKKLIADMYLSLYGYEWGEEAEKELREGVDD